MFVSQETHNETNFLMLCVAIGCNSPFTTVNLLCANTTVCVRVCAYVVISWQVFFLNPTSAASVEDYHHHMTSCIFPAVSELTCKDLTLVFSSFFFPHSLLWLSVCYTSGGQWWEKRIPETQHGLSCSIYKLLWCLLFVKHWTWKNP